MQLFYSQNIDNQNIILGEEETFHAKNVLRLKINDSLNVLDGKGSLFECKILAFKGKEAYLEIVSKQAFTPQKHYFHLAIAPTKSADRTEWFLEKAIEIGIQEVSFIKTQRTERKQINVERLQKIAISAMKQSQSKFLPLVNELVEFQKFVANQNIFPNKYIAHLQNDKPTPHLIKSIQNLGIDSKILLMIGPEGDFTNEEIALAFEKSFQSVSLGENTLRTETAGVFATSVVNVKFAL